MNAHGKTSVRYIRHTIARAGGRYEQQRKQKETHCMHASKTEKLKMKHGSLVFNPSKQEQNKNKTILEYLQVQK